MVISLESQNVRTKRNIYNPHKKVSKVYNYNKSSFKISFPKINFTPDFLSIPFLLGFVIFLFIFSKGDNLFLPKPKSVMNINTISLPEHSVEFENKNLVVNYNVYKNESYFNSVHIYKGETLSSLSVKYRVSISTILNYNQITDIRKFSDINTLLIPTVNGYVHNIESKDTLESLSLKYKIPIKDIFMVNNLKSQNISNMESIFIPYVNPEDFGWKSNIDKFYIYPLLGNISKRFGYFTNSITGITSMYEGLDFSPIEDLNVYASKSGYVSRIGYSANYGHYIYLDHAGGVRTLYAHLDNVQVSQFEIVNQGDSIGVVGNSGFASKTKLFFAVFDRDEPVDPERYLK